MTNIFIFLVIVLAMDLYAFQPLVVLLRNKNRILNISLKVFYWMLPILLFLSLFLSDSIEDHGISRNFRYAGLFIFSAFYIPKLFMIIFLLVVDIAGFFKWTFRKVKKSDSKDEVASADDKLNKDSNSGLMTRSEFISKTALVTAAVPLAVLGFGIVSGAHDYRIRRKTIVLPNLPKEFDGIRIAQVSDIHTGSFFNKTAVQGGVDMLMAEKADILFFTGDLVNNRTDEVNDYIDVFKQLKAPLGVYSVTGNHDYGDYSRWKSKEAKEQNFQDLIKAHQYMNYDLLLNENREIKVDGASIGVLGVENWGAGRFAKYGDLTKAYQGSEEQPVKILLSHDPSHWDAQVRKMYPDIDLTLSGHTHGFQFGVELGDFKWSPSQYIYEQWADLYQKDKQYIYVNRGYGFIGYPGRIGITPEITVLTLKKAV